MPSRPALLRMKARSPQTIVRSAHSVRSAAATAAWLIGQLVYPVGIAPLQAADPQGIGVHIPAEMLPQSSNGRLTASARRSPIVAAIASVESAVVNIKGNKTIISKSATAGTVKQEVSGMGAGVVIDPRGYIITNLHVVQDVPRIEVTLAGGQSMVANLLNYDLDTDLALIKVDAADPLPIIPFGKSEDLLRGETVIAIGNPFGYQNTVTVGVISALHRDVPVNGTQQYRDLIQTSADINPGNSGGPLVNIDGEVVGINVAVRVGAQGIGFAIPIDHALQVMAGLIAAQRAEPVGHGLSVGRIENPCNARWRVDDTSEGSMQIVSSRRGDGRAAVADDLIRPGDQLLSVDGSVLPPPLALELAVLDRHIGDTIPCRIERNGVERSALIALIESKPHVQTAAASLRSDDVVWNSLGVKLEEVDANEVRTSAEAYQGGLRVVAVRPLSPAATQKISIGDTIVGVANWQTPNWKALHWVLENGELRSANDAKFYVVRNNRTFYVAMALADPTPVH